jgi:hypothetical protein
VACELLVHKYLEVFSFQNTHLEDDAEISDIIRHIKSRRLRWAGHVEGMGEGGYVYRVLVGKHEGKSPLGRPRRGWDLNGS